MWDDDSCERRPDPIPFQMDDSVTCGSEVITRPLASFWQDFTQLSTPSLVLYLQSVIRFYLICPVCRSGTLKKVPDKAFKTIQKKSSFEARFLAWGFMPSGASTSSCKGFVSIEPSASTALSCATFAWALLKIDRHCCTRPIQF